MLNNFSYLLWVEEAENVYPRVKALFFLPVLDNNLGGFEGEVTVLEGPETLGGTANEDRKLMEFCHANLIWRRRSECWAGFVIGGLLLILL